MTNNYRIIPPYINLYGIFPLRDIDSKFYGITEDDVIDAAIWLYRKNKDFDDLTEGQQNALQYLYDIGYVD